MTDKTKKSNLYKEYSSIQVRKVQKDLMRKAVVPTPQNVLKECRKRWPKPKK